MSRDIVNINITQGSIQRFLHLDRCAHADGVCNANMFSANGNEFFCHIGDFIGVNLAFIRAAHATRDDTAHLDTMRFGGVSHRGKSLDTLSDATVDIFLAKGFTR